jgi:hypothetical protein
MNIAARLSLTEIGQLLYQGKDRIPYQSGAMLQFLHVDSFCSGLATDFFRRTSRNKAKSSLDTSQSCLNVKPILYLFSSVEDSTHLRRGVHIN